MFGNNREQLRQLYVDAWHKAQEGTPLEPLEQAIAQVISEHPEYQQALTDPDKALQRDYLPEQGETNPFLHMGMHLGIREQLATNRPAGIRDAYQALATRLGDAHEAEHQMMECLGEALWSAQRAGRAPDEKAYLACLRKL